MLQLAPVIHPADFTSAFKAIYEEAFPPDERRDWNEFCSLVDNPDFHLSGIYRTLKLIGFLSIWKLNEFSFIEHFAILKAERGKGCGTQMLNHVLKQIREPVILEVEEPFTEMARKRIGFYTNLNFCLNRESYDQPPYSPGKNKVKMLLMSYPECIKTVNFDKIKTQIYDTVYKYNENHY